MCAGLSVKRALAVWPTVSAPGEVVPDGLARPKLGSQPVFFVFTITKDSAHRLSQGSDADTFLYLGPETGHTLKCVHLERDAATGPRTGAIAEETEWAQVCGWPTQPSQRLGGAWPVGAISAAERAAFEAHLAAGGCAFYYPAASMYEAVFLKRAFGEHAHRSVHNASQARP